MDMLRRNLDHLGVDSSEVEKLRVEDLQALAERYSIAWEDLLLFPLYTKSLAWDAIKFIFLDVDGVLTEGGMFYTDSGDEFKRFDTKDGMAIKVAMKHGLDFGIISSGVNQKIIRHRADMFGIKHVYVGADPKLKIAENWLAELDLEFSNVAYIGDDINDLGMFEKAAIAVCPSDAPIPIKKAANAVLLSKGGHGCIREFMRCFPKLKDQL